MKVLFAVSNDKMSETIIKQYEKQYKDVEINGPCGDNAFLV